MDEETINNLKNIEIQFIDYLKIKKEKLEKEINEVVDEKILEDLKISLHLTKIKIDAIYDAQNKDCKDQNRFLHLFFFYESNFKYTP
jgi:hypothetical protein